MVWCIAVAAILVGTVLQRVSGTGVGLVCAPALALLLGSAQGVLVTNATTTVSGLLIGLAVRRDIDWRRAGTLIVAALPGAVTGALLVRSLPAAWLQIIIGAVVLLAILVTTTSPRLPHLAGTVTTVVAGTIGGLFNTTAGVAAPAMVIYSRVSRWEQRSFSATMQPVFMTMGFMSVVLKSVLASRAVTTPPWWFLPLVVGTVLVGIRLGTAASRRVGPEHARTLALALAGIGGLVAVVRGFLLL